MNRRFFISGVCSLVPIISAGCVSTTEEGSEQTNNTPEETVERYLYASNDESEIEDDFLHEESLISIDSSTETNIDIHEIKRKEIDEVEFRTESEYGQGEIVDTQEAKRLSEEAVKDLNGKDYAFVFVHLENDIVGEKEVIYTLVKTQEWKIVRWDEGYIPV